MAKYVLGKTTFGCIEAKQIYILEGLILNLEYIGKESKLSLTEKWLRQNAIRKAKKVIKSIRKEYERKRTQPKVSTPKSKTTR